MASEQSDTPSLKQLSESATPGEWHFYAYKDTVQISDGPEPTNKAAVVHWAGFDSGDKSRAEKLANAKFITALVNAYRAGELVQSSEIAPTSAAQDVLAERRRQVEHEGWDDEHDDAHWNGGLALAAACYASLASLHAQNGTPLDVYTAAEPPFLWPWERKWWKPKNPRRDLMRAAALILAEIERIDRRPKKMESDRRSIGYDRLDK